MMNGTVERRFLRRRLSALALILTFPLALLSTVSYLRLLRISTESAREEARQLTDLMTARMRQRVEEARQLLFCLSQIHDIRALDGAYWTPLFQKLLSESPQFLN